MPEYFHERPRRPGIIATDGAVCIGQMDITRARHADTVPASARVEHAGKQTPAVQITVATAALRAISERSAPLYPVAGTHRISYI